MRQIFGGGQGEKRRKERGKRQGENVKLNLPPRSETVSENLKFMMAALSPPVR
jgi:hypothetical protein